MNLKKCLKKYDIPTTETVKCTVSFGESNIIELMSLLKKIYDFIEKYDISENDIDLKIMCENFEGIEAIGIVNLTEEQLIDKVKKAQKIEEDPEYKEFLRLKEKFEI